MDQPENSVNENTEAVNFVHLQNHSEYSLTDGALRLQDAIRFAKEQGHTAVGLTDHANMFGAVEFYQKALAQGVKPLIGCEVFHQPSEMTLTTLDEDEKAPPSMNLILFAKSNEGYQNLIRVVSEGCMRHDEDVATCLYSHLEGFHKDLVAITNMHLGELNFLVTKLRKEHGTNPFNFDSEISKTLPAIESYIEKMKSLYRENFYIGISSNGLPNEDRLMEDMATIADQFGVELVVTSNNYYLKKDDKEAHTVLTCAKNDLTMSEIRERMTSAHFHMKDNDKILDLYKNYPKAISNTQVIADQCDVSYEFGKFYLPEIDFGTGETSADSLCRISREMLEERFESLEPLYGESFTEEVKQQYRDRLEFELNVINNMGFPSYFLIVQDFINWAKDNDIPVGPGRGSGAGSLVAYALRITNLDPIPYNLVFERFLNPERVSMPDFDIDFCQERREEVIKYVIEKYGNEKVAQITTFGKMLAKGAIRDVGRVLELGFSRVDKIARLIPEDLGITLAKALEQEPRLGDEMRADESINDLITMAKKLEGISRHTSVHAAGVVISDVALYNRVPVYKTEDSGLITQFEMKNAEKVGLIKFDFLGLKTLTVVKKAVDLVHKKLGNKEFDIDKIPMDDKPVYDLVSEAHSVGIFQLESRGMQQLLVKLRPSNFEDIVAVVALFRPGPLGSGMVDDFIERKHGRQKIVYELDSLEPILKDTYGIILYQEQVQKIAAALASYTLGEADLLRRAMGKKKPEEMAKQKLRFMEGCSKNGIDEKISNDLFDLMAKFAEYGFNKSHSAAYGLVSYQTAYLKTHYPDQFMAGIMTCDMTNTDKLVRYIEECRRMNIHVKSPNINSSFIEFDVPAEGQIEFGLGAIKGVGIGALKDIVEIREKDGPYKNLTDLAHRVNLHKAGKKTCELLITSGAFDSFGYTRPELMAIIADLVKFSRDHHENQSIGQMSLFDDFEDDTAEDHKTPWDQNMSASLNMPTETDIHWLLQEKKNLGTFLSKHPTELFAKDVERFSTGTFKDIYKHVGKKNLGYVCLMANSFERLTKKGNRMLSVRLEDGKNALEVISFDEDLMSELPPQDSLVYAELSVRKRFDSDEVSIGVDKITPLEEYRKYRLREKTISLNIKASGQKPTTLKGASALSEEQTTLLRDLRSHLTESPGRTRLKINISYDDSEVSLGVKNLKVAPSDALLTGICRFSTPSATITYNYP